MSKAIAYVIEGTAMTNAESIQVLSKEYDTLRTEIIARTTAGFQLVGVLATLFAALMAFWGACRDKMTFQFYILFALWIVVGVWFAAASFLPIRAMHKQLVALEGRINKLSGDELLTWESNSTNRDPFFKR